MRLHHGLLSLLTLSLVACTTSQVPSAPTPASQTISGSNIDTWRKQIIYLVLPDRFYNGSTANDNAGQPNCFDPNSKTKFHGGDLAGLRQQLGYIKYLGATTVWSTPVYEQVGLYNTSCGYHGYWINYRDPFNTNVEPKLGSSNELHGLLGDLHNNGMKFMMDMVVNHAGYGAEITRQHPDWFHTNCLNDVVCPLYGLPDFREEDWWVRDYLVNVSKAWASQYPIDAIRMDTAKHVSMPFWQNHWIPGINQARPNTFITAEAYYEDNAGQLKPYLDAGFDSTINMPLRVALVNAIGKGGSLDGLAAKVQDYVGTLGLDRALLQINLLDSHDVPRFVNEPGSGVPESEIRSRYQLALGSLFTLPGIPQLYYGNELGMYGAGDPDNRYDMPSWAWDQAGRSTVRGGFLAGGGTPQTTVDYVRKLASVRTANEALWKGSYSELWRPNGGQNVFAFHRGTSSNQAVVVMNTSGSSATVTLSVQGKLAAGTTLTDQLGYGAPATVQVNGSGQIPVTLPARTMAIYTAGGGCTDCGTTIPTTFQVTASTWFGQGIKLVGNRTELGNWNTASALSMTPSNCSGSVCTWKTTVNLPKNSPVEYKYIKVPGDNGAQVKWETGGNRTFTTPTSGTVTRTDGSFRE